MSSYKATITILFNNLKNLEKFCFYLNSQDPSNTSIWPLFDRKLTSNVFSYTNRGHFLKMSFLVTGFQNSFSNISIFSDFYSVQITGRPRPPRTKTTVYGPSNRRSVHVDNGPKFGLRLSNHRQIWTLDKDYHLKVDEWTNFIFFSKTKMVKYSHER